MEQEKDQTASQVELTGINLISPATVSSTPSKDTEKAFEANVESKEAAEPQPEIPAAESLVVAETVPEEIKANMVKIGKSLAAFKAGAEESSGDEASARSPKLMKKADKIQKLLARFESN